MITTMLGLAAAATTMQNDATRLPREAYYACLRQFIASSTEARTTAADFEAALPRQCTAQEAAYRAALIQRELGPRITRASAEQAAGDTLGEARTNFLERYRMSLEPR